MEVYIRVGFHKQRARESGVVSSISAPLRQFAYRLGGKS